MFMCIHEKVFVANGSWMMKELELIFKALADATWETQRSSDGNS